jgi:multicomponent Na+:H+ antiporter subunit F
VIAATNVAFAILVVAAALTVLRLLLGPTLADRIVATDLLLTFLVTGSAVLAARTGEGDYLVAMLVVAVIGFLGTAMVARFIERRGA